MYNVWGVACVVDKVYVKALGLSEPVVGIPVNLQLWATLKPGRRPVLSLGACLASHSSQTECLLTKVSVLTPLR